LIVHESSEILTRAALAADKQGKFIEFNNILFEREIEASQQTVEDIATELQMDIDKFRSDLNSSETTNTIDQDEEDADNLQITGTPTIFVNDQRVEDFRELSSLVKDMV
jgi:protein-disulfide isomerase